MHHGKIEWCYGIKSFLSLSNTTLLFPLYVKCSSTTLKFLQDFLKLALFPRYIFRRIFTSNRVFYFSQINVFTARHLSKIFPQSEKKRGFIWPKTFDFSFEKLSIFYSEKRVFRENNCSLIYYFSHIKELIVCHLFKI